jgi:hypothetical protein
MLLRKKGLMLDVRFEHGLILTHWVGTSFWLRKNNIPHKVVAPPGYHAFFPWLKDDRLALYEIFFCEPSGGKFFSAENRKKGGQLDSVLFYTDTFDPVIDCAPWMKVPFQKKIYKHNIVPRLTDKPALLISNKCNNEWFDNTGPPVNFFPLEFLKEFIQTFSELYEIWYIRHKDDKLENRQPGYWDDTQTDPNYKDFELIEELKEQGHQILTIQDAMSKGRNIKSPRLFDGLQHPLMNFNVMQCYMHSNAKYCLTINGGNANNAAWFSEEVMIYGAPNCRSSNRKIWLDGTWLNKLYDGNIVMGDTDINRIMERCKQRWIK